MLLNFKLFSTVTESDFHPKLSSKAIFNCTLLLLIFVYSRLRSSQRFAYETRQTINARLTEY